MFLILYRIGRSYGALCDHRSHFHCCKVAIDRVLSDLLATVLGALPQDTSPDPIASTGAGKAVAGQGGGKWEEGEEYRWGGCETGWIWWHPTLNLEPPLALFSLEPARPTEDLKWG